MKRLKRPITVTPPGGWQEKFTHKGRSQRIPMSGYAQGLDNLVSLFEEAYANNELNKPNNLKAILEHRICNRPGSQSLCEEDPSPETRRRRREAGKRKAFQGYRQLGKEITKRASRGCSSCGGRKRKKTG